MKKTIAIILALILVFSLAACSSGGGESAKAGNRLEEIKERGYIEMATEPYFAPYEFIDSSKDGDEQYQGLDIELGKYIAEKLGVELRIVPLEFSAVLASITEGKYDFAASALAYSPGRAENMNM
ncbi:MAG: transporter substrate-binding domain-containing protein, partial [Firmicutes bacterium]|nr:transporter substrate-binding domain-containing protein [Bacillota bacterium]